MSEIKMKSYKKPENIINPDSEFSIEVKNLRKVFKGKKYVDDVIAVDDISFKVKSGELFGFLGPNGAGKTTTINILIGLLKATSGTAVINGYDVNDALSHIKELIGVCPQEPAIFKMLTGKENIELFGKLHLMKKSEIDDRIDNLIKILDLSKAIKRKSKGYSGGMMRQLNMIISLIHDPIIAFLDEPTVGMDPRVRRKTWEFIRSLKKTNKTVFLTTHYIEEAEKLCDRVAIIDYGKLIEIGNPQELVQKYEVNNLEEVFMEITGRRIMEGM
ncbi:MAG: ATP-binding cassette domain-containing protein [Promethearchaeota archaeon]|nr:MAG: ATP-binding cassette domain-containing protein [Candidatus Lokiarchaeota archaeon]